MTINKTQLKILKEIHKDKIQFNILTGQLTNLVVNNEKSIEQVLEEYLNVRIYLLNQVNLGAFIVEEEHDAEPNPVNMTEEEVRAVTEDLPDL